MNKPTCRSTAKPTEPKETVDDVINKARKSYKKRIEKAAEKVTPPEPLYYEDELVPNYSEIGEKKKPVSLWSVIKQAIK